MDPITHAISGIAMARAMPKHPLPKQQVVFLALLTMAPDADIILTFFSDTVYLRYHRGITHSLLMLPLWTWMFYSLIPGRRHLQPVMPWLIGTALLMHIFLDLITSFGTMILAPLSDWRATLDLVFIVDPIFTALLLIPLLLTLIWKYRARYMALTALALAATYVVLTAYAHQQALQLAHAKQPQAQSVSALPLPFSPFHWQLIAIFPDHYRRTAVDLLPAFPGSSVFFTDQFTAPHLGALRGQENLHWQRLKRMDDVLLPEGIPGVAFYRWFARFPVLLSKDKQQMEFGDLRFGAGFAGADSPFRLQLVLKTHPQAWLVWGDDRKSLLHDP
ncbi:MAG: metal-dependent hydrolase [Mariprofundaceae bacterium]